MTRRGPGTSPAIAHATRGHPLEQRGVVTHLLHPRGQAHERADRKPQPDQLARTSQHRPLDSAWATMPWHHSDSSCSPSSGAPRSRINIQSLLLVDGDHLRHDVRHQPGKGLRHRCLVAEEIDSALEEHVTVGGRRSQDDRQAPELVLPRRADGGSAGAAICSTIHVDARANQPAATTAVATATIPPHARGPTRRPPLGTSPAPAARSPAHRDPARSSRERAPPEASHSTSSETSSLARHWPRSCTVPEDHCHVEVQDIDRSQNVGHRRLRRRTAKQSATGRPVPDRHRRP